MSEETKNKILNAIQQAKDKNQGQKNKYGKEKYLMLQLPKGQQTGKKRIRILPPKSGEENPIKMKYFHYIKVGEYYMKLYDPEYNEGEYSPLNEVKKELYNNGDDASRKLAYQYTPRLFYILRVIDRDNEQDGPKFWRFPENKKGEGIMDKLYSVIQDYEDITDPENGRDIILDLSKDDKGIPRVTNIRPADPTPLAEDSETVKAWINDEADWNDVYKKHPLSYLEVVAKGDTPIFDKAKNKFVSKEERDGVESSDEEQDTTTNSPNNAQQESKDATDTSAVLSDSKSQESDVGNGYSTETNASESTSQTSDETKQDNDEPVDDDLPF